MNKKNGFTLIELMGVVTILAILSLIIVPIIDKNVKKSRDKLYNVQIENFRLAAINYFSDNIGLKPTNGNYYFIKLDDLIRYGYFSNDVKNPKTGEEFENEIYIQLYNNYGIYEYTVCPLEGSCESYRNS